MLSNVKPLTSGDVIGIGVDKIKQDTKDVFSGFGDYIDTIINYLANFNIKKYNVYRINNLFQIGNNKENIISNFCVVIATKSLKKIKFCLFH